MKEWVVQKKMGYLLIGILVVIAIIITFYFRYASSKLGSPRWFKEGALDYKEGKPLQHFSRWRYWTTDDWVKHIEWGVQYLNPPLKDGYRVFEVGCGVGAYLQVLKTLYPNLILSGVDIVPETIQIANKVLKGHFYVADGTNLSQEKNNIYDYSVSNGVIGYLTSLNDAKQFVSEMVRITKKGQPIMISTIVENENVNLGSYNIAIPKAWWYENAPHWNVEITTISRMGDWPGAHHQGERYAVFMKKL